MEKIQHKQVNVGELKLHVAEIGSGPAVLLLHGFPEIWYSWRHQMIALADAGFRASDILKAEVPNLEIKYLPEGSHFVQEQSPEEVNKLLLDFLKQQL